MASEGTKYGDRIPEDHWDDPDETPGPTDDMPTTVKSHSVDVIHTVDPSKDMGYGRKKYTARLSHDEDGPSVLYFIRHRWKGNYWRDVEELDWQDVPDVVRRQVARVVAVDRVSDLDPGIRMIDEGGESRYEKIHKPRKEAMEAGEMWATSSLRDGLKSVEGAAEKLDGSDHGERVESLVDEFRATIQAIKAVGTDGDSNGA